MRVSWYPKIFSALALYFLLIVPVFTTFLTQTSQPSPTLSASSEPTSSVTGTAPTRSPSPTPLPGAQNFHQWGSITLFNGLPSDSVRAIAQTPDGVMWFGTDNGLARFDGRRIQKFSFGGSDANRVLALKTAQTGQLWIGTQKGAFVSAENGFLPIKGTENVGVTAIVLEEENFLGTDVGLVLRVKTDGSGTFEAEKMFSNPILTAECTPLSITSLINKDGNLLAGSPGRGVLKVQDGNVSEFQSSPRPIFVNSLAKNAAGKLWLGTDAAKGLSGIYSVESGSRAVRISAPTADVLTLEVNESGLWAGTKRNGLLHFAESDLTKTYTFENTSGGLRSDTIFTLFTDREGVIWIGTNRGVSRFDRSGPFQQTVSDIPNSNFIRTLFRAADGSVLAGSNRGLFELEKDGWKQVPGFVGKAVYAISEHRSTVTIVATPTGLFDLSGNLLVPGDTRALATFQQRTYAAVYGRGVLGLMPGPRGFGVFDPAEVSPPVIYSDTSATTVFAGMEKLWIGTSERGLISFDGNTVRSEATPDVLKSGTIWKIFEGDDHSIWIAGQHGVFRIRDGQPEKIIDAEDVRDLLVDQEQVWAATTTGGLLHARRDEKFGWLVSSVGFEQGLPSEKAFSILPVKDGLLIATNRGVVTYKSGSIAPKLIPTRILSQRMHDLAELRSTIELDYPQNSLLVEVAGQSSRTFPEEFQYAFILRNGRGEILDSRISKEPQYAPADLKPGNYSIESRAFDRDLLSSEPLTISFSIAFAPFPWTATALGVLLVIALIALIWAIIERRRIAFSNIELATARFDLANEAERERRRIARDLHDQTLADLRGLMMKSDRELLPAADFREEIESISTEIRRICEDLSPSVLENVGLVAALEFLLTQTSENHTFSAAENLEERIKFPVNVQIQIYRIAQEVLTNINRHSNADLVEMHITIWGDEEFVLTIRDNGKVFTPDSTRKGRGIASVKSRSALVDAVVEWQASENGGTEFSLRKRMV